MHRPLVSVIIPVYNRARYVGDAIESVLAQDYSPFELIVVDDGSTDDTAAVLRTYSQIRCLQQSNQGVSVARNTGIAASRGELLAFLDSDDLWMPDKLSVQVRYHAEHPSVGYSVAQQELFLEAGCSIPAWARPELFAGPHVATIPSNLMVHRAALERIGNFAPHLRVSEDVDWFLRARDSGIELGIVQKPLLRRRIHGENLSANVKDGAINRMQAMKLSLDRKRANNKQTVDEISK